MNHPQPVRRLVLVAGTGRSGTSTVTGVLQRLGYAVATPEVPADDSNPRGFGESRWVVDLHDELLRRAGVQVADARPEAWTLASDLVRPPVVARVSTWLRRQLGEHERLVVKDPRLAWFAPLWEQAAERVDVEPAYVTMLRPAAEVVGSRRARYNRGLEDAHGVAGWLNMVLGTERVTRGRTRALVPYRALLADWRGAVTHLDEALGLGLADLDGGLVDDFVDAGLRRERAEALDVPAPLARLVEDTWAQVNQDEPSPETLDRLGIDYAAYYRECAAVSRSSVIAASSRSPRRSWSASRWSRG